MLPVKDSEAGGCGLARGKRLTRPGPVGRDGRARGQHCPEQRGGPSHTSHGGTHRSAVVVPKNLLVEVVKELLLQLEHHLLGVGRQSRGPLPRAGPRRGCGSEQGPLPRAGPREGVRVRAGAPPQGACRTLRAHLPVVVRLAEYQLHDFVGVRSPDCLHRGLCAESLGKTRRN